MSISLAQLVTVGYGHTMSTSPALGSFSQRLETFALIKRNGNFQHSSVSSQTVLWELKLLHFLGAGEWEERGVGVEGGG